MKTLRYFGKTIKITACESQLLPEFKRVVTQSGKQTTTVGGTYTQQYIVFKTDDRRTIRITRDDRKPLRDDFPVEIRGCLDFGQDESKRKTAPLPSAPVVMAEIVFRDGAKENVGIMETLDDDALLVRFDSKDIPLLDIRREPTPRTCKCAELRLFNTEHTFQVLLPEGYTEADPVEIEPLPEQPAICEIQKRFAPVNVPIHNNAPNHAPDAALRPYRYDPTRDAAAVCSCVCRVRFSNGAMQEAFVHVRPITADELRDATAREQARRTLFLATEPAPATEATKARFLKSAVKTPSNRTHAEQLAVFCLRLVSEEGHPPPEARRIIAEQAVKRCEVELGKRGQYEGWKEIGCEGDYMTKVMGETLKNKLRAGTPRADVIKSYAADNLRRRLNYFEDGPKGKSKKATPTKRRKVGK